VFKITKDNNHLYGTIELPYSKSISLRAQILRFLHPGRIRVEQLSQSADAILLDALLQKISEHATHEPLTLHVANSGAVMRFLTAILASRAGEYLILGSPRMAQRPVGILVEALKELGADIQYLEKPNHLPILIRGKNLVSKEIHIDASESSQYISALLLLGSTLEEGLTVIPKGAVVSGGYIEMTLKMLQGSGFRVQGSGPVLRAKPEGSPSGSGLSKTTFAVERDWSSAAFWYSLLANAEEGKIFFPGLRFTGMQGDEAVAGIFEVLGVKTEEGPDGISITKITPPDTLAEWDFTAYPDLAPAVMAACAFLHREAVFTGLESLKIKESDRLRAMQEELAKIGCMLVSGRSGKWQLIPGKACKKMILFNAHDDHRIAMAMTAAVFKEFGYTIDNESVVDKSYPCFWKDLEQLGFIVR
jgi:3-phosphoshikimate 1-carboxyvinyltransferase